MTEEKKSFQDEYAEKIAKELIEMLQNGTAPWQKPWNPAMGRDVPYNHSTGHEYSGVNFLRLMMTGRQDPRWMTYRQAEAVGAQVRKGECGTALLMIKTHTEQIKKDEYGRPVKDTEGKPVKEMVKLERPYYRGFTVFNAEQIDGLPKLELPPPDWDNHERAEKLLAASGAEIHHRGDRAFYSPSKDFIVLPHKDQFIGQGEYYATALHELGHWTGHESRLNRDLSGMFGSQAYAREELRAEIASMMTCRELGLPHNPERHADYVGSWIKVLQEDPNEIFKASSDANKIKAFVLSFEQKIGQTKETGKEPEPIQPPTSALGDNEKMLLIGKVWFDQYTVSLPPKERQQKQILLETVECAVAGIPKEHQITALANFYQDQMQQAAQTQEIKNVQPEQPELFSER